MCTQEPLLNSTAVQLQSARILLESRTSDSRYTHRTRTTSAARGMGKRRRKVAPARAPLDPPKGDGTGDGADSETTRCAEADVALEAGRSGCALPACDAQQIAACKDGEAAARQVDGEEGPRAAGRVVEDAPIASVNASWSSARETTVHCQVVGDGASPYSSSGCSVGILEGEDSKSKGENYVNAGDLHEAKDSLRTGQNDLKEQARQRNDGIGDFRNGATEESAKMHETLERGRTRKNGLEGSADKKAMEQEMQNLVHTLKVSFNTTHELFLHQTYLSTERMHCFGTGLATTSVATLVSHRRCVKRLVRADACI